jgi:hypothetical protein
MLETQLTDSGRVQRLAAFERTAPWPASLTLAAVPGEGLVLVIVQGARVFRSALDLPAERPEEALRISFAWDSRAGLGRLAVERGDGTILACRETPAPPPLLSCDAGALVAGRGVGWNDVLFRAVSTAIEPLGPVPTLSAGTLVDTPTGPRPVSDLRLGDTVVTGGGEIVPVLAQVVRQVPALGAFRPVRLFAPYFGLRQDLVVARGQCVVSRGADVAYLFGCDAVLIPAQALVNGPAAGGEEVGPLVTWHHLLLPAHDTLRLAGAELPSLYVGRLRRRRDWLRQSVLAKVPGGLVPEHAGAALKVLKPFEAAALAAERAA